MDFIKARKAMVDSQVRPNDVPDIRLQKAMEQIPRELFVPTNRRNVAYVEKDIPLFEGRWLLKARDLAKLIHETHMEPTDLVLDVGCGYGYSVNIIAQLASVVVGLEEDDAVIAKASDLLAQAGVDNAAMVQGPLTEGVPDQGPYDVIILAGGVEDIPEGLLSQLHPQGGRLATIMMKEGVGQATLITRHDDAYGSRRLFETYPAEILPGFAHKVEFSF